MKIDIDDEIVAKIVVKDLMWHIEHSASKDESGYDITDYEMKNHLLHTLAYYTTVSQFTLFCSSIGVDPACYL